MSSSDSSQPSFVITGNSDGSGNLDIKDPRLFRKTIQSVTGPKVLIQYIDVQQFPSIFFKKMVEQINQAYSIGLYTATTILVRKLFENLLIELLRRRYGGTRYGLYYRRGSRGRSGRFQDFSILISNLRSNVADYGVYTTQFNANFFNFLDGFRIKANTNTHSIDIIEDPQNLESLCTDVNSYCTLICDVIARI